MYVSHSSKHPWRLRRVTRTFLNGVLQHEESRSLQQGIESCVACFSLFVVFVSYGCEVLAVTYLPINIQ